MFNSWLITNTGLLSTQARRAFRAHLLRENDSSHWSAQLKIIHCHQGRKVELKGCFFRRSWGFKWISRGDSDSSRRISLYYINIGCTCKGEKPSLPFVASKVISTKLDRNTTAEMVSRLCCMCTKNHVERTKLLRNVRSNILCQPVPSMQWQNLLDACPSFYLGHHPSL